VSPLGVEWATKYTLIGPDGTIAVFNDSTDPNFVGILSPESSGLDSPEVREDAQDSTEADGGVHGNFFYGRRPVLLQGTIIAISAAQRNERVSKLLRASNAMRKDATLKFKPLGATSEVELKLRRQQPARITKGYVKDFFLPLVSASAAMVATIEKIASTFEEKSSGTPTVVNATGIGTVAWTTPNNASKSDDIRTTAILPKSAVSNWLKTSNNEFILPTGATVTSIKALVEARRSAGTGTIFINSVRLVKAGIIEPSGFGLGEEAFSTSGLDSTQIVSLGASGFTKADVENTGFGVAVSLLETGVAEATAAVDAISVKVGFIVPSIEVENAGDADAEWEAVITQLTGTPSTKITIKNETAGEELVIETGVEAGKSVTINSKNRTIVHSSSGNIYSKLNNTLSKWFKLKPGKNKISITGGSIEIKFRDTWV
jgi:Phage tail protein